MRPTLISNLLLLSLSVVIAAAVLVGVQVYRNDELMRLNVLTDRLKQDVHDHVGRIQTEIQALRQDALFLTRISPVASIGRARLNGGIDTQDGSRESMWRDRLADIFTGLLQSKPHYMQIRLIGVDDQGREIVNVKRSNGELRRIVGDRLQRKGTEPYFRDTLAMGRDQVYLSKINLNREQGRIETPHRPVLRAAVPVVDAQGRRFGLIVINYDFRSLAGLVGQESTEAGAMYITNEAGDYLHHPDPSRFFGFDLGRTSRIQDDYPALKSFYTRAGGTDEVFLVEDLSDSGTQALHAHRILFDPLQPDRNIVLVSAQTRDGALSSASVTHAAEVGMVLIASGGVAVLLLTIVITRPLRRIASDASRIADGEEDVRLFSDDQGEIGQMTRALGAMTQRLREREQAARLGWARMEAVLDSTTEAIISIDSDGRIILYNRTAERMFGHAARDILGQPLDRLLPERNHHLFVRYLQEIANDPEDRLHEFRRDVYGLRQNGKEFPVEVGISRLLLDGQLVFTLLVRDMSSLHDIRGRKERLLTILENTPDVVATSNLDGTILYLNQAARQLLDIEPDEYGQHRISELASPRSAVQILDEAIPRAYLDGLWKGETWLRSHAGKELPVSLQILVHRDDDGHVAYLSAIARDISEQKKAAAELLAKNRALEEAYRDLEQAEIQLIQSEKMASVGQLAAGVAHEINNPVGYVNSNLGTLQQYLHDFLTLLDHYEAAEPPAPISSLGIEAFRQCVAKAEAQTARIATALASGESSVTNLQQLLAVLSGTLDELRHISDLQAAAAPYERMSPERLETIRALKASIDLGFLRGDVQNLVKESQEGLNRVKQIIQDLKDFSHVDRADWQEVDLHAGINSMLNIVWNEIKYKAEVIKGYRDLPPIECIPSQLNQVFLNILVNAAQAIETRGTITIRTGKDGEGVFVEIQDTGKGMAPEVQKRIFEPFYTTKPVGKGTGLGLSLSYDIVQKHHGRIDVTSTPGEGTTFRVWLPVRRAGPDQQPRLRDVGT